MTDTHGPGPGVDLNRLTAELDARLDQADAALARGFPGSAPGRQPVHTVYVPADRFHSGTSSPTTAPRHCRSIDEHETLLLGLSTATATCSRACGTSSPASRSRTCASTSRTATAPARTTRRTRTYDGRPAAARGDHRRDRRRRSPASGSRASRRRPAAAACGPWRCSSRRLVDGRSAPGRLRRHAAQGHLGRAGRGAGPRRCSGSRRALGLADARAALRDPGRDPAVDPRPRRHRAGGPDDPRVRRPLHRPPLRHLRLLRLLRHRRRPPEPRAPRRRPRQGGDAGRGGRHRRTPLRRLHQRPPGGRRRPRSRRRGPTTCGSSAARWSAATTRAGTSTRRSCRPGSRRPSRSTATGSRPPPPGCAPTSSSQDPASSTSRRPPGRWPTSCCAVSTAAPCGRASHRATGLTPVPWPGWRTAPAEREAERMGIVLGPNQYGKAENRVVRIVPRHRPPRDPRPQRLHVAARRLRGRAHRRRPVRTCCPPTPRRTPRSPSPRSTASPRPRTTPSRSAGRLLEATPAATERAGARSRSTPGTGSGRRRRPRPRVRPPRRRGPHHRGRRRRPRARRSSPGLKDLVVLKSTGSEFKGFLLDEYTTLAEADDRILATVAHARGGATPTARPRLERGVRRRTGAAARRVRDDLQPGAAGDAVRDGHGPCWRRARGRGDLASPPPTSTTSWSTSSRSGSRTRARSSSPPTGPTA